MSPTLCLFIYDHSLIEMHYYIFSVIKITIPVQAPLVGAGVSVA